MLRLLYTRHRGLGGLILLLLVTACLSVAVRPCLIAASLENGAQQSIPHEDHGSRLAAPDQGSGADAPHCPKAVCASLEAGQHQLSKHSPPADAFQPLLLAAFFWVLPLALLLTPPRPLSSPSHRLPKLPPALRFRVLLI